MQRKAKFKTGGYDNKKPAEKRVEIYELFLFH